MRGCCLTAEEMRKRKARTRRIRYSAMEYVQSYRDRRSLFPRAGYLASLLGAECTLMGDFAVGAYKKWGWRLYSLESQIVIKHAVLA